MKSFKQHLLGEAFDKPYSFQKTHTVFGDDGYDYTFKTEDGRKGEISVAKMDRETVGVSFSINNSQRVTGEGDAFHIFATVRAALDDALKTIPNVKRISFTAEKPREYGMAVKDSRGSLYSIFAKKLASHYGMRVDTKERSSRVGPGATTFVLIKESLDKPYKFTIKKQSQEWFYNFKLENGRHGQVDFMFAEWDGNIHVDFAFDIDGEISTTGGGDQFRIFATVKAALLHFLENHPKKKNINSIRFEGSKDSARGEDAGRVRLYHRFAKEISKKYKMRLSTADERWDVVFKLIKEEYVDHTMRSGDVWKNPTSREFAEYLKELPTSWDFAGCLDKRGNVYLFTDGLHEDLEIGLKLGNTIKFRGEIDYSKKIIGLAPSGGSTSGINEKMLEDLIKVYNHKSLHHHFDKNINEVFGVIRAAWNGKFADYQKIMRKHNLIRENPLIKS